MTLKKNVLSYKVLMSEMESQNPGHFWKAFQTHFEMPSKAILCYPVLSWAMSTITHIFCIPIFISSSLGNYLLKLRYVKLFSTLHCHCLSDQDRLTLWQQVGQKWLSYCLESTTTTTHQHRFFEFLITQPFLDWLSWNFLWWVFSVVETSRWCVKFDPSPHLWG